MFRNFKKSFNNPWKIILRIIRKKFNDHMNIFRIECNAIDTLRL